ncbi:hypothetical protein PCE1_001694 [Barthelona sp. PCE]
MTFDIPKLAVIPGKEVIELFDGDSIDKLEGLTGLLNRKTTDTTIANKFLQTIFPNILDKDLKQVSFLFLEKHIDSMGAQEALLCEGLNEDIRSINEYVAVFAMRFVGRVESKEIARHTLIAVLERVEDSSAYVRQHAVAAFIAIVDRYPDLFTGADEILFELLQKESDSNIKRLLYSFVLAENPSIAFKLMSANVRNFMNDFTLASAIVQMTKKHLHSNMLSPPQRNAAAKTLHVLLQSDNENIRIESVEALISLSPTSELIENASQTYIDILMAKQSDSSMKARVIQRLSEIYSRYGDKLKQSAVGLVRSLRSVPLALRDDVLNLIFNLISPGNAVFLVSTLKSELSTILSTPEKKRDEKMVSYCMLMFDCLRKITDIAPESVVNIDDLVCSFVYDSNSTLAHEACSIINVVAQKNPELGVKVALSLTEQLSSISDRNVLKSVLFTISRFCVADFDSVEDCLKKLFKIISIEKVLGLADTDEPEVDDEETPDVSSTVRIAKDGSYVQREVSKKSSKKVDLSAVIADPSSDFDMCAALCVALTKLVLPLYCAQKCPTCHSKIVLLLLNVLKTVKDNVEVPRVKTCLHLLFLKPNSPEHRTFDSINFIEGVDDSNLLKKKQSKFSRAVFLGEENDEPYAFRTVQTKSSVMGSLQEEASTWNTRVMTGSDDKLYVECILRITDVSSELKLFVYNTSDATINNFYIDLIGNGDVKIAAPNKPYSLKKGASVLVDCEIIISSTEAGCIFGSIDFQMEDSLVLDCYRIDLVEFLRPHFISNGDFRRKWASAGWENRVVFRNFTTDTLTTFVKNLGASLNMSILDDLDTVEIDQLLCVNFSSLSIYNDHAMMNVSIDCTEDSFIKGIVRIRAHTQGVCQGLGTSIKRFVNNC